MRHKIDIILAGEGKTMSLLSRSLKAIWEEVATPESFVKGEEFEEYVRKYLFPKGKYTLLHRTHNYKSNKDDYIEETKEPDFMFRVINSGKEFYVEAKYRSSYYNGAVEWCKAYQLRRYKEINHKTPLYVVIGIGEQPSAPGHVFFVPVGNIKYPRLFRSYLKAYDVRPDRPIDESLLH